MRSLFAVGVFLLFTTIVSAQNTIRGRVIDQDSLPLAGANVAIPDINKTTVTDQSGYYVLANLPQSKLKIQFTYLGHASKIATIVPTDSDFVVNAMLKSSTMECDEIVITGGYNSTQHENAVKIDILKINSASNRTTPNFTELLTKIPGVDMISKGNGVSKPVIRGLSMNNILVLNNGVRFENYQYSSHHPLGIDEFGIEDVEIIKGPASLLYGSDAIGGIINFIKEKPASRNSVVGDYNMQLFSNSLGMTNNLGIKGASDRFFGGLRVGQKTNADYLQGGGKYAPNSRFNEYSIKTNAGYSGKAGSFKLYYDYNRQNLGLVEDEAIEQIANRGRKCNIFYQQLNTHMLSTQNRLYVGKMKVDANASYQNTELIHFGEVNEYEIQMKLATLSYETKLFLPSDKKSEYILGFQGINQRNTNLNDRSTILLPDATTNNYSAFCLIQRTFFEKLKLQTGVRYDYKTLTSEAIGTEQNPTTYRGALNNSYGSFSGSLGATYAVTEKLLLRANVASAYRTPNLAELSSNGQHETRYEVGDQKLGSEYSYETDLSLHYHLEPITFDMAGFYNAVDNYIFISPTGTSTASGIPIYKYMQSNSDLYGGEVGVNINPLFAEWLQFRTALSSVVGKQHNGDYLPFIPAHKLNFELKAEREKLSSIAKPYVSLSTTTAFEQKKAAPDETVTSGYTLVDLSVGGNLKVCKSYLSLAFSVTNMFDKKYVDHLSTLKEVNLYNPGRSISISVKVPFAYNFKG